MPAEPKRQSFSLLLFIAAVIPLWVLATGYNFGTTNHNEQLPLIARAMDANFLRNDWFVNSNTGFNHRTVYIWLMALPARVIGLEATYFLGYLLLASLLAWGVARLGEELEFSREAAMIAAAVVLFNRKGTLGQVGLTEALMLPGLVSWTLGVWAMVMLHGGRHFASATLLLLTGILHWLIGPETAVLAVGAALIAWRDERRTALLRALPLYGVAMMTPFVLAWWAGRGGVALTAEQSHAETFVLTYVRHPWHYIPWTWPRNEWLNFALFAALVLVARRLAKPVAWLDAFACFALVFAFLGIVPLLVGPLFPLVKLQTFRMTVWAQVAGGIYIGKAIWELMRCGQACRQVLGVFALTLFLAQSHSALTLGLAALAAVLLWLAASGREKQFPGYCFALTVVGWMSLWTVWQDGEPGIVGRITRRVQPHLRAVTDVDLTAHWARDHTAPKSVFLIPPFAENFRWHAQRAVVVDFKTFPWRSGGLLEWRARLQEVCGGQTMTLGNAAAPQMDKACRALSPERLRAIGRKFGAKFVLLPTEQRFDDAAIFTGTSWKICPLESDKR